MLRLLMLAVVMVGCVGTPDVSARASTLASMEISADLAARYLPDKLVERTVLRGERVANDNCVR